MSGEQSKTLDGRNYWWGKVAPAHVLTSNPVRIVTLAVSSPGKPS